MYCSHSIDVRCIDVNDDNNCNNNAATATTPPAFHMQVSPHKLKVQNEGKILYFKVSVVHREVHLYRFSYVECVVCSSI